MIEDIVYEITTKMHETEDKFLMETILPYCSSIERKEISKKQLIEALEKQIPRGVEYVIDDVWGITRKQAICPECGRYLSHFEFFGDGERLTYCEHCGQKIDWSES